MKIESYGIKVTTLPWIKSFLSSRRQCVVSMDPSILRGYHKELFWGHYFPSSTSIALHYTKSDISLFDDNCILYRKVESSSDS